MHDDKTRRRKGESVGEHARRQKKARDIEAAGDTKINDLSALQAAAAKARAKRKKKKEAEKSGATTHDAARILAERQR